MFLKVSAGKRRIFFLFAALFLTFLIISPALADSANYYKPLVQIPGMPTGDVSLTQYLSTLYNFLISIVGILAMGVIIYGGMRYMTSAGNPTVAEDAKETIMSAVYGLALALGSWLVINVVNPDILVLKNPGVGLPGGRYSYGSSQNNCIGAPTGTGTKENPCVCLDGAKAVNADTTSKTATKLTLTVSPNPASSTAPGNNVTMSGKLTDASGAVLSGKSIKINMINATLNASSTFSVNTNGSGDYSVSFNPCATGSSDVKIQSVFAGDTTYASIGSDKVQFTVNGLTICTGTDYASPPLPLANFWNGGNDCQAICSDASKQDTTYTFPIAGYHCLGPQITVSGTNVVMNPDGISANMKVNSGITIDGKTNSIFPDDATKSGSTWSWTIGGFTKTGNAIAAGVLYPSDTSAVFTAVGNYEIDLRITPTTGPGVPQSRPAFFYIKVVP